MHGYNVPMVGKHNVKFQHISVENHKFNSKTKYS